jgi:cbb3-type cytochrome oxidase subunit 1
MNRFDLQFLVLAALSLLGGVMLGIFMAASQDHQLMPVHAHINLVGWVSLALFGLVYRAYPELGRRRLAKWHMMLAAPAALLMPPGIAMVLLAQSHALATVASFLWLGACVVFLLQLLSLFSVKETDGAAIPAE